MMSSTYTTKIAIFVIFCNLPGTKLYSCIITAVNFHEGISLIDSVQIQIQSLPYSSSLPGELVMKTAYKEILDKNINKFCFDADTVIKNYSNLVKSMIRVSDKT